MTDKNNASNQSRRLNRWIIVLIIIGVILIAFFGFRTFRSIYRVQRAGLQPGATDVEALRGWMTIFYIEKIYKVPSEYIFSEIDIPESGNKEKSLADLNRQYFPGEQAAVLDKVKKAILQFRTDHPVSTQGSDR